MATTCPPHNMASKVSSMPLTDTDRQDSVQAVATVLVQGGR